MKRTHTDATHETTETAIHPSTHAHPHAAPKIADAPPANGASTPPTANALAGSNAPEGSAASSGATTGASIVFIAPPPATANIPRVPPGWVPRPGADWRGTQPKSAELAMLAGAIDDLRRFASWGSVLGATVPPLEVVLQVFLAASQWSAMRISTDDWEVFARAQEGLSWGSMRSVMETLRPAFDLAVTVNKSLETQFPSLAALLGAQKVIARKGAAARAANKADIAAGKTPSHGKAGKAQRRKAEKAALTAAEEASGQGTAPANGGQSGANGGGGPGGGPTNGQATR